MPIHAVLFDFDGTLADTRDALMAAFTHAVSHPSMRERNLTPFTLEMLQATSGVDVKRAYHQLYPQLSSSDVDALIAIHRQHALQNPHLTHAFDGAAQVLSTLHARGVKLAIVTNRRVATTLPFLEPIGLPPVFGAVVGSDSAAGLKLKPAPDPFLLAASLLNVPPAECLAVGDAANDIIAGHAAGCKTARVTFGHGSLDALPDGLVADYSLNSLSDVLKLA